MKKNYICLYLFFIFVCCLSFFPVKADQPLNGKIFVIDPGHGGVDPGTVVGTTYEKDINLKISLFLRDELQKYGATVYMTREGDYDLGTPKATYRKKSDFDHRISFINNSNANYYISIHLNYLEDSTYFGPQVFFNNINGENQELANSIQVYLNDKLKTDRDVKELTDSIYMYSRLKIPGVLVECGFLSNFNERSKLLTDSYIKDFSNYLAESFLKI